MRRDGETMNNRNVGRRRPHIDCNSTQFGNFSLQQGAMIPNKNSAMTKRMPNRMVVPHAPSSLRTTCTAKSLLAPSTPSQSCAALTPYLKMSVEDSDTLFVADSFFERKTTKASTHGYWSLGSLSEDLNCRKAHPNMYWHLHKTLP